MADLVVELLAVEDCPHLEQARHDLESILRAGIIEVPIQLIFVTSPDDAEFLGFQGSPTIRINGDDVVPQPELPVALACRVYRAADGRALGSPPIESIRSAIDSHRRGRLEEFQREEAAKVAEFARATDGDDLEELARAADAADLVGSSGPADQAWSAHAVQLARATGGVDTDKLAREDEAAESSAESEGMPPQG